MKKFMGSKYKIPVDKASISKFLSRAQVLSGKDKQTRITFKVVEGRLALEHSSAGASTEEYFLASGLDPTLTFSSIAVPIELVSSSLGQVNSAVLDYLSSEYLVLSGENPEFRQIIGGQKA
jgi:hypothetical protein